MTERSSRAAPSGGDRQRVLRRGPWLCLSLALMTLLYGCAGKRIPPPPLPPPPPPLTGTLPPAPPHTATLPPAPPPLLPGDSAPVANASCDPCVVEIGQPARLTAQRLDAGDPLAYQWSASTGELAQTIGGETTWTATEPGAARITLTATSRGGRVSTTSVEIHVMEPPAMGLPASVGPEEEEPATPAQGPPRAQRDGVPQPLPQGPGSAGTPASSLPAPVPDQSQSPPGGGGSAPAGTAQPVEAAPFAPMHLFQWVLLGIGVSFLLLIVAAAVFIPVPTVFQQSVFRTTLALGASLIAAAIPWFVAQPTGPTQAAGVVGSGLAVFVLVFLFNPVERFQRQGAPAIPPVARTRAGAGCVFISYRRSETSDLVGRLHERLEDHFGHGAVFKDVNDITPGLIFRDVITGALQQCRVAVVVIGPDWEHLRDQNDARKLDDPDDFVVLEIASALSRRIPVIPALVQRTSVPAAAHLPASIAMLRAHHAMLLRPDPDFPGDLSRLIQAIETLLERSAPHARQSAAS